MSRTSANPQLLGVVILARHGDREGFYQDPASYTPADTSITPLGNHQEYLLGQFLRRTYLDPSSDSYIQGISSLVADDRQLKVRGDAGGERGVIFNSVMSMLQGLFPPTPEYNITLANGTTVVGPLGGYQTVPIESVESDQDVSLEGWVACKTFSENTQSFFDSPAFAQKRTESATFLAGLLPYLGGRPSTLENMWNIFDYLNVQSIHNATFASSLPPTYLQQARALANWQQSNIFSSPHDINGIGNIAGRTMIASILDGISSIVDPSDSLKVLYQGISYKPFISLFRMTGAIDMNPALAGIVNYAAAISFEIRAPRLGELEPTVRLVFKNGTEQVSFRRVDIFGSTNDVPLSIFINTLAPTGINGTEDWCSVCRNTEDRGCGALTRARLEGARLIRHPTIGPVGAGFLGASLALVVASFMIGTLLFVGVLTVKKRTATHDNLEARSADGYDVGGHHLSFSKF